MESGPNRKLCEADFEVLNRIGVGAFSDVSLARFKKSGKLYALKRLVWALNPERISNEIKFMLKLDHPCIVKLICFFRENDHVTLVLEYVPHTYFRELLPILTPFQIKCYMYQLLIAIAHLHKHRIIHRDIKPANFLFDIETNRGKTIDCGLCETDISVPPKSTVTEEDWVRIHGQRKPRDMLFPHLAQHKPKMVWNRAGTRGFRAPEVLMAAWNQSCKIDVWSAGVILLCLLTRRYPFFKAGDDVVSLCEVASIVGSHRLELTAIECLRRVSFPFTYKAVNMKDLVISLNPNALREEWDDSVFDLLTKLLEPIPSLRITAAEAANHDFFVGLPPELAALPKD